MKKISCTLLLILLLICNPLFGQNDSNSSKFTLSAGLSYNTLYWEPYDLLNLETLLLKRNNLWLQPNIQISYGLNILELGNESNIGISVFTGYNSFGGKSKTEDSGYKDYYVFHSVEYGLKPFYSHNQYCGFLGIKSQYIFSAKSKAYGSFSQDSTEPREWSETNVSSQFKNSSFSLGITNAA